MNNEETIIMQPQDNGKAKQTANAECSERANKGSRGNKAATAAAAMVGGAVGSGATYAATTMLHGKETEEQKPKEKAPAKEEPVAAAKEEPQKEQHVEAPKEEVAAKVDAEEIAEADYTGNNGADPVTPNPEVHAAVDDTSGNATSEVQVLGVYEVQGGQGQAMQAAVLTNGEEVAAVFDIDGDGVADVLAVDENHNQCIDEGEVYDLSNEHVQMSDYQQAYLAQQQEQMQQEHETFAYNADNEQTDYNNDVDPQFV